MVCTLKEELPPVLNNSIYDIFVFISFNIFRSKCPVGRKHPVSVFGDEVLFFSTKLAITWWQLATSCCLFLVFDERRSLYSYFNDQLKRMRDFAKLENAELWQPSKVVQSKSWSIYFDNCYPKNSRANFLVHSYQQS